jgi:hypothetical protein
VYSGGNELENGGGLTDLEGNLDVIGLLEKLKSMAFSTGGVQEEPFVILPGWQFETSNRHTTRTSGGGCQVLQTV